MFIQSKNLDGFDSLSIKYIEIENRELYPIANISQIFGYSSPYTPLKLVSKDNTYPIQEVYGLYTVQELDFSTLIPEIGVFKKGLSLSLTPFHKPLIFINKEGVKEILARNNSCIESIKTSLCKALNIEYVIHSASKETQFYESLATLLKDRGYSYNRHLYVAGYLVDVEVLGNFKHFIIEYDENNHAYYDKDKEKQRENALQQLGYHLIRIDDSKTPLESALLVLDKLEKEDIE